MAFALHFRSHPWHPISTAPCNRGVELRVREGTAVSTLEFPCQRTNAGDWINCDFGTPIRIQPVEWRAWYGHSPQPQSLQVNVKRRLSLPRHSHRNAKRLPQVEVKLHDRPARRQKGLATMAYALIGIVVVATVVGSLTRISAWALPIGLAQPTPASSAAISSIAAASPSRTQDSCKEFGAAFLNAACATPHKRFAVRRIHRVATFVVSRSDAQQ
jgi:heme A synthase